MDHIGSLFPGKHQEDKDHYSFCETPGLSRLCRFLVVFWRKKKVYPSLVKGKVDSLWALGSGSRMLWSIATKVIQDHICLPQLRWRQPLGGSESTLHWRSVKRGQSAGISAERYVGAGQGAEMYCKHCLQIYKVTFFVSFCFWGRISCNSGWLSAH